jgi:hypothetical protein
MKYLITERQYNKLLVNEYGWYPGYKAEKIDPHILMTVLAIGTAFIPVAGPFISAGIGLADAAMYYKEGDKTSAGVTAAFSMIPFIGKIPGVKEFGSKAMAALGSKVAKGIKVFSPAETKILNTIKQNETVIKQGLESASKKIPTIAKDLQSFKPSYIERFGQESYDNLFRDFLSGKSDKEYFIQTLKSAQKASPNLANFVTKFGIKFGKEEISQIAKVAENAFYSSSQQVTLQTKSGPRLIKIFTVPKEMVEKNLPANASANMFADASTNSIYIVKDNVANLTGKQLEDILVHEFAHIKDPSIVKSTKFINLYNKRAIKGIEDWANATKLRNLEKSGLTGLGDKAAKLEKSGMEKYYLNPNEIIANNTMVIQQLATNTSNLKNIRTKKEILSGLDNIISFAKGSSTNWSEDAAKLLGYNDPNISQHFQYLVNKPSEYRKLWTKLAQQAEYLKSQIKLAM